MERSDLDLVTAERAPRDGATCKRVSGHAESLLVLIGEALLWLWVSWTAWSIPIFLAVFVLLRGARATDAQSALIVGLSGVAFVLSWVVFVWLVMRGRNGRRTLVRDGVLVDGVLVDVPLGAQRRTPSSATIRFSIAGVERHAVSGAARGEPGGRVPILWTPGSRRALVFPSRRNGRAVAASVRSDIVIDRADNTATIVFRRGYSENILAVILAIAVLELPVMMLGMVLQRPERLQCDRATNECSVTSHDITGREFPAYSFRASDLASSTVLRHNDNEVDWIARLKNGHEVDLGGRTASEAQARIYDQRSAELNGFIANPSQPTLAMDFPAIGQLSWPPFILTVALCAWFFFAWANAWQATLTIDSGSRTLTIQRRPALTPPAKQTIPFSSIARIDVRPGVLFLFYAAMSTVRLRLYDAQGKQLFGRWQVTSRSAVDEIKTMLDVLPRG